MARNKETVRFVRYPFSAADLFANWSDLTQYDTDESAKKYARLCGEALKLTYPNAVIEVIDTDAADKGQSGFAETYVETWTNFEETPDIEETKVVEDICQRVFDQVNDWLVSRNLIPISHAKDFSKIPPAAIRWACVNDLLEGVSKATGYWNVPLDELLKIGEIIEFVDSNEALESSQTQKLVMTCYLEDVKDTPVIVIPEQINLLVTSKEGFSNPFFKPDNSLFLVHRVDRQAQVEVEHFVDVGKWSDLQWSYDTYARMLSSQLTGKKIGFNYQWAERNDNQEIDGVSFTLSKELTEQITLQILVDEVLHMLLEVVNDTELSLAGGPVWKDIYDKDERRFCKDMLEPLLRKMGFLSVRYTQGPMEKGRDFIFAEKTPFGRLRYYGLQAKAGNVRGGVNSEIDGIIRQIDEAFSAPIVELGSEAKNYISTMVVAISGDFTDRAKDRIVEKIPPSQRASIYFLNKDEIRSLITYYWGRRDKI
jgi:hypothetical protein